ncbi:MAG: DUF1499 domain-containing protein [Paracoccaceae bacterium]|nr:DUF1499 domain-containing protein [Paracoccaceae bacterium]
MNLGRLSLLTLALLVAGVAAYVRLAPSDSVRWHIDPADPALVPGEAGLLVRPEGGDIAGPVFDHTPGALLATFDAVARATPRTRVLAGSVEEGRITYVTRSALWGFPDYTTVETIPAEGGARLMVYARSRFGGNDWGVNRARVEAWLARLGSGA